MAPGCLFALPGDRCLDSIGIGNSLEMFPDSISSVGLTLPQLVCYKKGLATNSTHSSLWPGESESQLSMTLLQQLGGLVLGSTPTMILFLITLAAYRLLVHAPLKKVLRRRYDLTQGAIGKAHVAIAAAEARTVEYEERLRAARAAIFRERHERLHSIHLETEKALTEARVAAQERVASALIAVEQSAENARLQLDGFIGDLTADVLRAVLSAGSVSAPGQS